MAKSAFYFNLLLLAGLVAVSCEKIDNEPETGGPDPVEDPSLWLWSGEDRLLRVSGDMSAYAVSSAEEEVAAPK